MIPPWLVALLPWLALLISLVSVSFAIAAYVRAGTWREQERREAQPYFVVTAEPITDLQHLFSDDEEIRKQPAETGEVLVTVENRSSEAVSLNHAAFVEGGKRGGGGTNVAEDKFPTRVEPKGGQVSFSIPGWMFDPLMEYAEPMGDGRRREKISVFVSMDPWTNRTREREWHSRVFMVERIFRPEVFSDTDFGNVEPPKA
ncbi:hypothetical protein [Actinomycetospora chibensis]|uniref:Uncharacterized protein n=1 Tax=Actinomycetospora chibensis TaxID=663606 RepID=A0ABV9RFQ8_9PSEU|nr:hypothetical protein [Actinomycetospora chibensis]MDD7925006.1 hypothetical protein [Actinomycetospora chibensis]